MRNFFILCAVAALASAVSLSHEQDNEFDLVEQDAEEFNTLAQVGKLKGIKIRGRKVRTPTSAPRPKLTRSKRLRNLPDIPDVPKTRTRTTKAGGSSRLNRSNSSPTDLPSVDKIKIPVVKPRRPRTQSVGGSPNTKNTKLEIPEIKPKV
jgi:hypothetical protein